MKEPKYKVHSSLSLTLLNLYLCPDKLNKRRHFLIGDLPWRHLLSKADIEDDIHAYRHHDISLSSWSQDQAPFFKAVITPWDFETANRQSFLTCISFSSPIWSIRPYIHPYLAVAGGSISNSPEEVAISILWQVFQT